MAYIGNKIPANFQSLPAVQRFNGNASATAFTLASAVANDQSILVSVDGVTQDSNAYAVSGTTLTFTAAPSSGTGNVFVHTISPVGSTVVPPDGLAITATTGTFSGALSTIAGTITTASNEEDALLIEQADGTDVGSLRINNGSFIIKGKNASSPVQIQTHDGNEDIEVDPDGFIKFETAGSERMRIDSSGNVLCGTSDANGTGGVTLASLGDATPYMLINQTSSGTLVFFRHNSSTVGTITQNGSATAYNTSSDYRLKENVDYTWDATTRLKQLKPARFNFIIDETNTLVDGFIAHEVSSIVPEAISGTKDAMAVETRYTADDVETQGDTPSKNVGDPKTYSSTKIDSQGIDQSKLVPLLVKTIQELEARLTAGGL